MKALSEILGLYKTSHTRSKWKCPWCEVDHDHMGDFCVHEWPLRDLQKMRDLGTQAQNKSASAQTTFANKNFGIKVFEQYFVYLTLIKRPPLLPFAMQAIIPCMLHAVMALTKLMLRKLTAEADQIPEYATELREIIASLGLTLVVEKKGQPALSFSAQLKKSRFARPEYLIILENYEKIVDCWKKHTKKSERYKKGVSNGFKCDYLYCQR